MITIAIIIKLTEDRERLAGMLASEKEFAVVYAGADGYDALMSAKNFLPDIIIMDLRLPAIDGTELALLIKCRFPSISLVVLLPQDDDDAERILQPEISGYLPKQAGIKDLIDSVKSVFYGGCYISGEVKSRMSSKLLKRHGRLWWVPMFPRRHYQAAPVELSDTECQILNGIACGRSDQEIAADLNMAAASVRNCICAARRRTGLRNRSQMVLYALEQGSITLPAIFSC